MAARIIPKPTYTRLVNEARARRLAGHYTLDQAAAALNIPATRVANALNPMRREPSNLLRLTAWLATVPA